MRAHFVPKVQVFALANEDQIQVIERTCAGSQQDADQA
ncbi:MAG: Uncharacterised protein [Cryomorphaceae bacterium]|nr:MAG: Uncharacterised protein [Cryomorphaceae bacterium]